MTRLAVVLIAHGHWNATVKVSGLGGFLVPAAVVGDINEATERVNRAQYLTMALYSQRVLRPRLSVVCVIRCVVGSRLSLRLWPRCLLTYDFALKQWR